MESRDEEIGRVLDAIISLKKSEDQIKQHAIFIPKSQSTLRFTLGFSNIHCEL